MIRKPGDYGDGLHSYSKCMDGWADDINNDGQVDQIVIGFLASPPSGTKTPRRALGYLAWSMSFLYACNETPLYTDLFGDGRGVLVMATGPAAGQT